MRIKAVKGVRDAQKQVELMNGCMNKKTGVIKRGAGSRRAESQFKQRKEGYKFKNADLKRGMQEGSWEQRKA